MTTLTDRIREHAETAVEFVKLAWRHRGCLTCMNAELDAERERLYAEIIGAARSSRLSPLDVSYRFGVDDQAAVDITEPAPHRPIRYETVDLDARTPGIFRHPSYVDVDEMSCPLSDHSEPIDVTESATDDVDTDQDVMTQLLDKVLRPTCDDLLCARTDHVIGFNGRRYHPAAADTAGDGTD